MRSISVTAACRAATAIIAAGALISPASGESFFPNAIIQEDSAPAVEKLAAREIQRYVYLITGKRIEITEDLHGVDAIVVGTLDSNPTIAEMVRDGEIASIDSLGDGYLLKMIQHGGTKSVMVAGASPVGCLHGAYTLLEHAGVGFYLGGDTVPPRDDHINLPDRLDEAVRPAFKIRGALPWPNFLNSPMTWDLEDFKFYFDQLSKMKCNFVGIPAHSSPFAAFQWEGRMVGGGPLEDSITYAVGTVRGMKTAEFGYDTGDYFFQPVFGARTLTDYLDPQTFELAHRDESMRASKEVLIKAFDYARSRGIKVCLGFTIGGDPTDETNRRMTAAKILSLLRDYPMLDYIWFWQSEGLGEGAGVPGEDTAFGRMVRRDREPFGYLRDPERISEAVRFSSLAQFAHEVVRSVDSEIKIIVSGWGGDRWLLFTDFYIGLDRTLPKDVIFAALDNIDPTAERTVSDAYRFLQPDREFWPIPWWESDGGGTRRSQWSPQCNVEPFTHLCRDALHKKAAGLVGIHWQTRGVEDVASYMARFCWHPELTYQEFFTDYSRRSYGEPWAKRMSTVHQQLEALGPRYTGYLGQAECMPFDWSSRGELKTENLAQLARLRGEIAGVRDEMLQTGWVGSLERVEWQLATIDWITHYDTAAHAFLTDDIERLLSRAEEARAAGDAESALAAAGQVRRIFDAFERALRTHARKVSTKGEWGNLATINVKAWAEFQEISVDWQRRLEAFALPGDDISGETTPHIVMPIPSSLYPPGKAITLRAIVIARSPSVSLRYRTIGENEWNAVPMANEFRKAYVGTIPAEVVTEAGIEFFVAATDSGGQAVYAPRGFPQRTWSVTVMTQPLGN